MLYPLPSLDTVTTPASVTSSMQAVLQPSRPPQAATLTIEGMTQDYLGDLRVLFRITIVLGIEKTPSPYVGKKFPNNPGFFPPECVH